MGVDVLLCVSTVCVGVKMTWMGSTMKATMLGLLFNLEQQTVGPPQPAFKPCLGLFNFLQLVGKLLPDSLGVDRS